MMFMVAFYLGLHLGLSVFTCQNQALKSWWAANSRNIAAITEFKQQGLCVLN